jgi:hypothetical protein
MPSLFHISLGPSIHYGITGTLEMILPYGSCKILHEIRIKAENNFITHVSASLLYHVQ